MFVLLIEDVLSEWRRYMQEHLYMKVFPCAPVLGADHTIDNETAGEEGRKLYLDYGPMFSALIGGCWYLAPRPVLAQPTTVVANAFTRGGGYSSGFGTHTSTHIHMHTAETQAKRTQRSN